MSYYLSIIPHSIIIISQATNIPFGLLVTDCLYLIKSDMEHQRNIHQQPENMEEEHHQQQQQSSDEWLIPQAAVAQEAELDAGLPLNETLPSGPAAVYRI